MTQQSAYSSMSNSSTITGTPGAGAAAVVKQEQGGQTSETSSVKTLKDSSYSTATSSVTSGPSGGANMQRSSETASALPGGNDIEVCIVNNVDLIGEFQAVTTKYAYTYVTY